MRLNGKRVDLLQLRTELVAAGLTAPALGVTDDDLYTYTAAGEAVDLPAGAAAVLAAHTPPAIVPDPLIAADARFSDPTALTAAELRVILRAIVRRLRGLG